MNIKSRWAALKCRLGFHQFMDLQRRDETLGQSAVEECLRCKSHRYVFRPLWGKDGQMHPRVEIRA
jgi:hypothetical protein